MSVFDRHPKKILLAFTLALLILIAGAAEIALRFIVPYDIGYYSAVREPGRYTYPYGTIFMNDDGYPDAPFDKSGTRPRIGYFGDSVTFGVGTGAGYRFSDLLEARFPQYDHWTFGMIANGVQGLEVADTALDYGIDTVVYAFNLNDILPIVESTGVAEGETLHTPFLFHAQGWVMRNLDGTFRGKSYLYNTLRTAFKNALTRLGYGHTGFKAAELFPSENASLIADVAERINALGAALAEKNIGFCVILLPYEMQVSRDAETVYADLGIAWEKGFEDGKTQGLLKGVLKIPHVYDGRDAFEGVRETAKTGEYFVYNQGDKIDFNHPNRAGHARLTQGLLKSHSCPAFFD